MVKLTEDKIKARVVAGAAYLDKTFGTPNWATEINLDGLEIDSCMGCVLGQLSSIKEYDLYLSPSPHYPNCDYLSYDTEFGFISDSREGQTKDLLNKLWKTEIRSRLEPCGD